MNAKALIGAALLGILLVQPAHSATSDLRREIATTVQKGPDGRYRLEWQRRLAEIQRKFATTLAVDQAIDNTVTGSISPSGPAHQQR